MNQDEMRLAILRQVREYASAVLAPQPFVPGQTSLPPSGKTLNADDFATLVDAALDGWLTTGRFNDAFESELAAMIGVRFCRTTNSGSSANLLALSALTSPQLGARALKPGDEVITAAAGFPTTVNPILQNGLIPVFVDSAAPCYNPTLAAIKAAIGPKTRAIMLAHTLGIPFEVEEVRALADSHNLWLVEDCCDALGSTYRDRNVGTFGHIGTLSFYPAHHITMGEGGAVFTDDAQLAKLVESFRDWGRDCYCPPGRENTCGKRYEWQLGDLPRGYDHKYIYTHAGYNLKISDMQAAVGLSQLRRVGDLIAARKRNFTHLWQRLSHLQEFLILPEATPGSDPSWFGFPVTLTDTAGVERVDLLRYLDQKKIGTRLLMAGNLVRQPYFSGREYRISGTLAGADNIMTNCFWVGIYQGLDAEKLDYLADQLGQFFGSGF